MAFLSQSIKLPGHSDALLLLLERVGRAGDDTCPEKHLAPDGVIGTNIKNVKRKPVLEYLIEQILQGRLFSRY